MNMQKKLDIKNWAQKNFENIPLGDKRRVNRVINIAQHMATFPGKSIPQLFKKTYSIKASYELFKHPKADPDNMQKTHRDLVYKEMKKSGTYLLIEDTSALSWSGNAFIKGLGPIGKSSKGLQGFFLHSTIAMRWNEKFSRKNIIKEIIGLAAQQYKVRLFKRKKLKRKTAISNLEELESNVWEKTIDKLPSLPKNKNIRWVRVCDRGADIYEVLLQCKKNNYGFVIRSAYDRLIYKKNGKTDKLFSYSKSAHALGSFLLFLRSRPGMKARTVKLSVSTQYVKIKSPQRPGHKRGALPSIECSVVRIWEANPPKKTKAIEWILLCDKKITTFEEALTCANQYSCRWIVEDFHKALKTGVGAEKLQLETSERLFSAISIMSIVALRLLSIREMFRFNPNESATKSGLSDIELKVLEMSLKRKLKTVKDVNLAIGRLGGHLNRKNDGPPGLLTLWRGMNYLLKAAWIVDSLERNELFIKISRRSKIIKRIRRE
jgi:hypothetical protein